MLPATRLRRSAIVVLVCLVAGQTLVVSAQDPEILPGMPGESLPAGEPPTLISPFADDVSISVDAQKPPVFGVTGDWFGARQGLYDNGISFKVNQTQFYQGITTGGLEQQFEYGMKFDYFGVIEGEKLFGWSGLYLNLHGESRFGESVNSNLGALIGAEFALQFPQPAGTATALTNFQIAQYLTDDFVVYAGKINTPDGVNIHPFMGGYGTDRFMNTGFVINPMWARILPYSTPGAGFTWLKDLDPVFTVMLVDPMGLPGTSGLGNLFSNGVSLFTQLRIPTQFFDRRGHQTFEAGYSNGKFALSGDSYVIYPPAANVGVQTGTWGFNYGFDQLLVVDPDNPRRGWGVFGNFNMSDGNPNPIRWFLSCGLAGISPLPGRSADSFGIGYYFLGASSDLKNRQALLFPVRDEQGGEVYYDWSVTPWFRVTADLQGINPGLLVSSASLLVGLRAKIIF